MIPQLSTSEPVVSPVKSASPGRFSDEEIRMTLRMPSDPFGAPGGFFDFLDPPQEMSSLDGVYPLPDSSPNFDFVTDFEADLDYSYEMVGDGVFENAGKDEPTPLIEVNPSPLPVSTLAPCMPTIFEEDEQEQEEGDVTITPSEAQKALLPPDRFARPPSTAQVAGSAGAEQDVWFDSLDTPRPGGEFCFAFCLSGWFDD